MLTERQSLLLEKIVKDYIRLAQPIGSHFLKKRHHLPISSATIRIEMQQLAEKGFLSQPHTSSGRIPTDKGYRFLVNKLLREKIIKGDSEAYLERIEKVLEGERKNVFRFAAHLAKALSEASSALSIIYFLGSDFLWKEGWEEILREPEFREKKFILNFASFLDDFEENINSFWRESGIQVFIGRENPLPHSHNFSVITSKCYFPGKEKGIVAFLGPKRMRYEKNITLLENLIGVLEEC